MKGWLRVSDNGVNTKAQLQHWVNRSHTYAQALGVKK